MSERNRPALTPGKKRGARTRGPAHSALPAGRAAARWRRTEQGALLAGAGAVGAAVVLSACGGGERRLPPAPAGPGAAAAPRPAPAPAAPAAGGDAAPGAWSAPPRFPKGGGRIIADAAVVITQPQPGEFKAFDLTCTHQRCPVSRIADGKILCTCHNSAFSISDGSPLSGPATRPLAAKEIVVEGDRISLA